MIVTDAAAVAVGPIVVISLLTSCWTSLTLGQRCTDLKLGRYHSQGVYALNCLAMFDGIAHLHLSTTTEALINNQVTSNDGK